LDQYLGAANVSNIDKQRVAAVQKLEQLGYSPATDAIEAYETLHWPNGKVEGGKG
jgi:hypothetical protein